MSTTYPPGAPQVLRVCAVTVAYNCPEELTLLLRSLQTQPAVSGLVVLDNSREPYLQDNMATFRMHAEQYQFAQYVHLKGNTGSAAGFCQGMKIAHEEGFNFVWLLDQDGTVEKGCLASLLQNVGRADILCPQIVDIDYPTIILPQSGAMQNFLGRMIWVPAHVSREISFFGTHGALISKKVLDKIGYYDAHQFFVGSEDSDYAFRSKAEGMKILLVAGAKAPHPDSRYRTFEKTDRLIGAGVIDSMIAEKGSAVPDRLRPSLLLRVEAAITEGTSRLLPEHLGYVSSKLGDATSCRASQGLASLSFAFLATKRLTTSQLTVACFYSLFFASVRKIIGGSGISLKKTITMYSICLLSKLRKEWPFESVQQFCMHLTK